VKQIVAELTPVLRGSGNYFRTGNADREFNKMDGFVVKACGAGSIGEAGRDPRSARHSLAISSTGWVSKR